MIRHISFDLGGVIFKPGTLDGFIDDIITRERHTVLRPGDIQSAFDRCWEVWNRGIVSAEQFWSAFNEHLGTSFHHNLLSHILFNKDEPDQELVDLIFRLGANRYSVGALTDAPKEWIESHRKNHDMDSWFDSLTASCYVGETKPALNMYDAVSIQSGTQHKDIVHIDDRDYCVTGAIRAGQRAIIYKDNAQLKYDLSVLGVKF